MLRSIIAATSVVTFACGAQTGTDSSARSFVPGDRRASQPEAPVEAKPGVVAALEPDSESEAEAPTGNTNASPGTGALGGGHTTVSVANYGGGVGASCSDNDDCKDNATSCNTRSTGGMCTRGCSRLCPDTAASKTFCVMNASATGGVCVPKCNSDSDCRVGYACVDRERANRPETRAKVCQPRVVPSSTNCMDDLKPFVTDALDWNPGPYTVGARYECSVKEPVRYSRVLNGVFYHLEDHGAQNIPPGDDLYTSCAMAQALYRASDVLRKFNVTGATFRISFACDSPLFTENEHNRNVTGHARGDAIDLVELRVKSSSGEVDTPIGEVIPLLNQIVEELQLRRIFSVSYTPVCQNPAVFTDLAHLEINDHDNWLLDPAPICE